jgi:ubiquinone/menaquinone biosynthesis C-methylase UbiE
MVERSTPSDGSVEEHFDQVATDYDRWKDKAHYYYENLKKTVSAVVPPGASVLDVGCGTGDVLAYLRPSRGVGIDISAAMVDRATAKHPGLRFAVHDITQGPPSEERFDHVVALDLMEHVPDPDAAMRSMAAMIAPGGQVVVVTANPRWAPLLHTAERLHLKMPEGEHTWRTKDDLEGSGRAAGLELAAFERSFVVPKAVPLLKRLNDSRRARPLRERYGLIQLAIFTRAE